MISIIIPTYHEERVLETTLKRLTNGFTLPHEIIVSDAGSKDTTVSIAQRYADQVTVWPGEKPPTIARGRNDGARLAKGEYLVFLDADCGIEDSNTFFTEALQRFEKDKKLTGLSAKIKIWPKDAKGADVFFYGVMNCIYAMMNNVLQIGAATGEFQMMRRAAFERLGGFREDLVATEDMNMFSRLAKLGRTRLDPRLAVFNDGRRPHALGWPKLLWSWFMNTLSVFFVGKAHSKVWKVIR